MVEGCSHARMGTFEVPPAARGEAAAPGAVTVGSSPIMALAFDSRRPLAARA